MWKSSRWWSEVRGLVLEESHLVGNDGTAAKPPLQGQELSLLSDGSADARGNVEIPSALAIMMSFC